MALVPQPRAIPMEIHEFDRNVRLGIQSIDVWVGQMAVEIVDLVDVVGRGR